MFLSVHADQPQTRDADDKHIYLIVDVLPDAASLLETNQVGVEVSAPFEGPDHALPAGRRSGDLAEVHGTLLLHTPTTLTRPCPSLHGT
jgi:hypothetical protein